MYNCFSREGGGSVLRPFSVVFLCEFNKFELSRVRGRGPETEEKILSAGIDSAFLSYRLYMRCFISDINITLIKRKEYHMKYMKTI